MGLEHFTIIHAIQLVSRKDQIIVGVLIGEMLQVLPHRIGRPLIPIVVVVGLLGCQNLDESIREGIEYVGVGDMVVQ